MYIWMTSKTERIKTKDIVKDSFANENRTGKKWGHISKLNIDQTCIKVFLNELLPWNNKY